VPVKATKIAFVVAGVLLLLLIIWFLS